MLQGRFVLGITLLRKAWLKLLILLPMVPSFILLARASSSADCVTDASVQASASRAGKGGGRLTIQVAEAASHARSPVASLAGIPFAFADRTLAGELCRPAWREGPRPPVARRFPGDKSRRTRRRVGRLRLHSPFFPRCRILAASLTIPEVALQCCAEVLVAAAAAVRLLRPQREKCRFRFVFFVGQRAAHVLLLLEARRTSNYARLFGA